MEIKERALACAGGIIEELGYETVDVEYLASLSDGAVPYLARLMDTEDPAVAQAAENALANRRAYHNNDFRDWNYVNKIGEKVLDSLRD